MERTTDPEVRKKKRNRNRMKILGIAAVLLIAVFSLAGCGSTSSSKSSKAAKLKGEVTASGSSALQPLASQAAEDFMAENPDVTVTVNGGGSGTGLKQVADGAVDIGNSDVFASEKLDKASADKLKDHKVALITVAPVVNKDLGVDNLTTDQLVSIFTGQTTNWSQVGGPDLDIMLVTRPESSGTRALFKQYALNGAEESSNSALETDDSGTLMQTVKENKGAIGYVALSYLVNDKDTKAVKIDGTAPTLKNTYSGKYKVWGYEHMYTNGKGNKVTRAFIKYMTSSDYEKSIEDSGYGVASKLTKKAVKNHDK